MKIVRDPLCAIVGYNDFEVYLTVAEKKVLRRAYEICCNAGEALREAENSPDEYNIFDIAGFALSETLI